MVFYKMHRTFKDHSKLWCFLQIVEIERNISQIFVSHCCQSGTEYCFVHSVVLNMQKAGGVFKLCIHTIKIEIHYHNLLFLQSSSLFGQLSCCPVVACKDFRFIPIWNLHKLYIYEIWNANLAHRFIISYRIFCFLPNIRNIKRNIWWVEVQGQP